VFIFTRRFAVPILELELGDRGSQKNAQNRPKLTLRIFGFDPQLPDFHNHNMFELWQ
jgi:hypothetical protein